MSDRYALDDAAVAALFLLSGRPAEHMGALYGDALQRSNIVSEDSRSGVKGRLQIPGGASALRALFHNHPPVEGADSQRARFSDDDKAQARRLGVPSYISAGDRVMRYADGQTEEVLAEFPWDEFRAQLMRTLLDRSADDSRGLMR